MSELTAESLDFAVNQEPRCPCVLVLDVSGSMSGDPIRALNEGLATLQGSLREDPIARTRVELAIVTFGPVQVTQDFVVADEFVPPSLRADGSTPMGEALVAALDLVEARKQTYRDNDVNYYRPWVWLMTDGSPTDKISTAEQRALEAEQQGRASIYAIGVGDDVDMTTLGRLSPGRDPLRLKGLSFVEMFRWLSKSQSQRSRSSNTSEVAVLHHQPLALPAVDGWASTT